MMESSRLRANRESFQTNITLNGETACLADPIMALNPGRSMERPLSASSTYSFTTTWPFRTANSRRAFICDEMERSTSCLSLDTLA